MATYKGIQGYSVQKLSDDPTASEAAGQLWYNSTSGAFKISTEGAGAWASSATMNTATYGGRGIGTTTALVGAGGDGSDNKNTETYNGTAWTTETALNTGHYIAGSFGASSTSAMMASGYDAPANVVDVEEWNGSAWTEKANVNTARRGGGGAGIVTAGLIFGGYSTGIVAICESWNGSAWTETADLNTAQEDIFQGIGTQTASQCVGPPTENETFNGTSWSEQAAINAAGNTGGGSGTSTDSLIFAGGPGTPTRCEKWDGTSWTELADVATAKQRIGSTSTTSTSALKFEGSPATATTEEWSEPVYTIKTVTVS